MGVELNQVLPSRELINVTLGFVELAGIELARRGNNGVVGLDFFVIPGFTHQTGVSLGYGSRQCLAVIFDGIQHPMTILEVFFGQIA